MEFDAWGGEVLAACDVDALLDFENKAPASRLAHPRTDHFAPLFVALGAAGDDVHEVVLSSTNGPGSTRRTPWGTTTSCMDAL